MFGFVFNRNAVSPTTGQYWIECYQCIRKFYPDAPILIVDSFSDPQFISKFETENCTIVQSELEGSGYLSAYYYFHKLRPFDKAVIIHDSVFMKQTIDFDAVEDVRFMWSFTSTLKEDEAIERRMLGQLQGADRLLELYSDASQWHACFGCTSVITWDFLDKIKYIFDLVPHVKTMVDRMCLERVMAVVMTDAQPILKQNPSVLGRMDYESYFGIGMTWDQYVAHHRDYTGPAIKIWTRRN